MRPSRAAQYSGWEESERAIAEALVRHAPIDGLLGFSQGATATALFLAHAAQQQRQQQEQQQQSPSTGAASTGAGSLEFAVIIAGFLPRDAEHAGVLETARPALRCLHVHGAADALVPHERSAALWECIDAPLRRTYEHGGAHMVPTCSGEFKQQLVDLLDDVVAANAQRQSAAPLRAAGG